MRKQIPVSLLLSILVFQLACGPQSTTAPRSSKDGESFDVAARRDAIAVAPAWQLEAPRTDDVTPTTPYSTGVGDDGAATIQIPIWTPPGRGGVQPELALTYSSRAGHGLAGLGFQLSGLLSIERCWKTVASDGRLSETELPDGFCLGGKRLIRDGINDAFFPEGDPGTRVSFLGPIDSPDSFIIESSDGLRTMVGSRADLSSAPLNSKAKVSAGVVSLSWVEGEDLVTASTGTARVVAWLVDRVEDRWGNFMEVEYARTIGAGTPQSVEVLPASIRYTGNLSAGLPTTREVKFDYRPSARSTIRRVANVPVVSTQILTGVRVFSEDRITTATKRGASKLVRRYALAYQPLAAGARQLERLASVTECFASPTREDCASPVTLSWKGLSSPRMPTFTTRHAISTAVPDLPLTTPADEMLFDVIDSAVGDFNGDGYDDYLVRVPTSIVGAGGSEIDVEAAWKLSLGSSSGLTAPQAVTLPGSKGTLNSLSPRVMDLDLDGKDDVVLVIDGFLSGGGSIETQHYDVFQWTGADFAARANGEILSVPQLANTPSRSASFVIGDIDGDGIADLTTTDGPVNTGGLATSLWVRRGQLSAGGFSFLPGSVVAAPLGFRPADRQEKHLLDANGDGRPELLARVPPTATELTSPYSVDGLGPFLHSFELQSGGSFVNRNIQLWARDKTLSKVAEEAFGAVCRATERDFLSRLFIDVDGDGLRDSVSIPLKDSDSCITGSQQDVRDWQGAVLTAINQGGVFTAPAFQVLRSGAQGQLRVGQALIPETGSGWFDPRDEKFYTLADRAVSPHRTIDNGLRVVDFDDDGRQDLMLVGDLVLALGYDPVNRKIAVALSNGAGFDPFVETTLRAAPSLSNMPPHWSMPHWTRGSGPRSVRTGDFNGDGLFDIVMVDWAAASAGGSIITHTQNSREPDVIQSVSAGPHTQAVNFTFAYLGPTLGDRLPGSACVRQMANTTSPVTIMQRCPNKFGWVVTRSSREANSFDTTVEWLDTTYRYGTPIFDTRGRGFLGFGSRQVTVEGLTESFSADFSTWFDIPGGGFVYTPKTKRVTEATTPAGLMHDEVSSTPILATSRAGYRLQQSQVTSLVKEAGTETSKTNSTVARDEYGNVYRSYTEWLDARGGVLSSREIVLTKNDHPDEALWLTNRYERRADTSTEKGSGVTEVTTRTYAFVYEADNPRYSQITVEPDAPSETPTTNGVNSVTDLGYDGVGNLHELEIGNGSQTRLTTFEFDGLDRQFPVGITNAMGQQESTYWHAGLGLQFAADDANEIRERRSFDTFLRPVKQLSGLLASDDITRGGAEVAFRYTRVRRSFGVYKRAYWQCAISSVEGQSCGLVDPAGHATELAWNHPDGVTSQTVVYDRLGRAVAQSLPSNDVRETPAFVTRSFDRLNRIMTEERPGESLTALRLAQRWVYAPSKLTYFNERGIGTVSTFDRKGRPVSSTTSEPWRGGRGVKVEYGYTTFDQRARTVHPALNVAMVPPPAVPALETSVQYDVLGRVIQLNDPDLGTETRLYSSFGELKQATDANGGVTTLERDALGRALSVETRANGQYPARRNGYAMRSTFEWDTASFGIGRLVSATSGDGVTTAFTFDGFGRPKTSTWTSNGVSFEFRQEYDTNGRVTRLHYPSPVSSRPFVLRYDYGYSTSPRSIWDVSGTISGAAPAAPASLLWHAISRHGSGRIQEQQFGNTTRDTRRFDTGHHLRYVESKSIQSGAVVQQLAYQWDRGLIKTKTDLSTRAAETYGHDFLGRLSSWVVDQNCTKAEWAYHYDDWGNLRRREVVSGPGSDVVSQYTTASKLTHPHAVKELSENGTSFAYSYKPGGQAEVVRGAKVQWSPFGLPVSVSDGWGQTDYEYDAFNARFLTSERGGTWVKSTISIGGLFEQEFSGTTNVYKYSVHGPEGVVAQVRRDFATSLSSEVTYVHADHLGSPDTVTNSAGAVVERIKHDPFGQRRHPYALAHPVGESLVLDSMLGFTGHKAGDRFGLTDMRGRIYDAAAASFLSPDPIQGTSVMGLGRMAYVQNSPIMLTDPSGLQTTDASAGADEDSEAAWDKVKRITIHGLSDADWKGVKELLTFGDGSGAGHERGPLTADQNAGVGSASADGERFVESLGGKSSQAGSAVGQQARELQPVVDVVATATPYTWPIGLYVAVTGNQPSSGTEAGTFDRAAVTPLAGVVASIAAWKIFNGIRRLRNAETLATRLARGLPGELKVYGRCDDFAAQLVGSLVGEGVSGERIYIKLSPKVGLSSTTRGLVAPQNSFHEAVVVGGRVFDNLHPTGLPFDQYFDDLGGYRMLFEQPVDEVIPATIRFTPF